MPKNKREKYERVKTLPNVTIIETDDPPVPDAYPWNRYPHADAPTILELGCGKGEYSLTLAVAHPTHVVIGVDCKSHRICVGAEAAIRKKINNVHFLRARVEQIKAYFRPHSIGEIWLTFPDPHVKNRKAKCRLTAAPFLDAYADLLAPGGVVHLITDSTRLYDFTQETVLHWGGQMVATHTAVLHEAISAYGKAALSRGASIQMLTFTLNKKRPPNCLAHREAVGQ